MEEPEAQSVPPNSAITAAASAEAGASISSSPATPALPRDSGWPSDDDELATLPGLQRRSVRPVVGASVKPEAASESAVTPSVVPAVVIDDPEDWTPTMIPPDAPLAVAESAPAVVESAPAVVESAPAVVESPAAVAESAPAVVESPATVAESPAAVVESLPAVVELSAAIVEPPAAIVEPPAAIVEPPAVVEPAAAIVDASASSEPIVPVPTLKVVEAVSVEPERPEAEAPTIEVTSIADDESQELAGASSMSAQVVPIHSQEKRKRRAKKARALAVATTPVVEDAAPTPAPSSSRGYWIVLVGAAALAGLWLASRPRPDDAKLPVADEPAAARELIKEPAPTLEVAAAPVPQIEPMPALAKPPEPAQADVVKPTEPAMPTPPTAKLDAGETEPARLTAYKAVMAATKSAENCRYRGDSSGKVPIVVEFGGDGRVQRTKAKGTFANPMTSQCIVSKFSALTIPATVSAPIIITADVTLR